MTELEVLYKDLDQQEQRLYKQSQQIEHLERELAAKDTQITKLTSELRVVTDFSKVHKEQHAQSRENAQLLYTTLRRVAPDVLKSIEGALWQSTNEYDKLMSEGRRWQDKFQRSEIELAESREECRRLQFALTEIGKGYDYLHKYNAPDHKKYTGESLFGQQWSNYEGFDNFIRRVIAALLAPKVGDK